MPSGSSLGMWKRSVAGISGRVVTLATHGTRTCGASERARPRNYSRVAESIFAEPHWLADRTAHRTLFAAALHGAFNKILSTLYVGVIENSECRRRAPGDVIGPKLMRPEFLRSLKFAGDLKPALWLNIAKQIHPIDGEYYVESSAWLRSRCLCCAFESDTGWMLLRQTAQRSQAVGSRLHWIQASA